MIRFYLFQLILFLVYVVHSGTCETQVTLLKIGLKLKLLRGPNGVL